MTTIHKYSGGEAILEAQRSVEAIYKGGEGIDFFTQKNPADTTQESSFLDTVPTPSHDSLANVAFSIAESGEHKLTPGQVVDLAKKTGDYLEHVRTKTLGPDELGLAA